MTREEALKLAGINISKIIHNEKEEDAEYVVFGTYQDEQIMMCDNGSYFTLALGIGRKCYKIFKDSGKVKEFKISVA